MAGTIVADTLEHSTAGSIATNYVVEGSAKVWVSNNGTTAVIDESFGISSVADNGVGDHTYTTSVAFAHNTKHGGLAAVCTNNIGFARLAGGNCTTSAVNLITHLHSGGNADIDRTLSILGDLA